LFCKLTSFGSREIPFVMGVWKTNFVTCLWSHGFSFVVAYLILFSLFRICPIKVCLSFATPQTSCVIFKVSWLLHLKIYKRKKRTINLFYGNPLCGFCSMHSGIMWAHLTTIYLNYYYTHHVEAPNEISIELKMLWFFFFSLYF